jgi:predicted RNA polymerase sigma factor
MWAPWRRPKRIETDFRIERVGLIALLPAAKSGFLFRTSRLAEATVQFERAAGPTRNEREKTFLLRWATAYGG